MTDRPTSTKPRSQSADGSPCTARWPRSDVDEAADAVADELIGPILTGPVQAAYRTSLRHRLEDALEDALSRVALGVSFGAACEDVCVAYGLDAESIEEFAEEQQRAEVAIAQWEGADR